MAEDKNFNILCTRRVTHTLTTPGLITRTYMLLTHWQTSCLQIPLWLDDLQYKETTKIPQTILIPSSLWLFNTSQKLLQSTVPFASTIQTRFLPFIHHTTAPPSWQCLACPPPFLFCLTLHPLPTALATPPMSLPLLPQTVLLAAKWPFCTNKWSSISLVSSMLRKKKSAVNSPQFTPSFPLIGLLLLLLRFSSPIRLCWLTPVQHLMMSMTMRASSHPLSCHTLGQNSKVTLTLTTPTVLPFPVLNHFPFLPLTFTTVCRSHPQSHLQLTPPTPHLWYLHSSKMSHLVPLPLFPPWPWFCTSKPKLMC